jgi:hypothetical protein
MRQWHPPEPTPACVAQVSTTLLDLLEHTGVRWQMALRHSVRGMLSNVFVNLRLYVWIQVRLEGIRQWTLLYHSPKNKRSQQIPERWFRDGSLALPMVSALSERKVSRVYICVKYM